MRNGYPGYVAGATFAQALGWQGAQVTSAYAACASGATAIDVARSRILAGLCDVALVVGADTTPKGFLAPTAGTGLGRPRLAAVPAPGRHQPDLLRPLRPPAHGPVRRHRRRLRQGEGQERPARPREPERPLPQGGHRGGGAGLARWWPTRCGCSRSAPRPTAPRPWCCRAWTMPSVAGGRGPLGSGRLDGDADVSRTRSSRCPNFATDSAAAVAPPGADVPRLDRGRGLRAGGHRARTTSTSPRSTTCRRPSSSTGTRTSASASRARPSACCTTATPPSADASPSTRAVGWPASARPSPPRPSPRCASWCGSCGGRPGTARSRAPGSASRSTRACSATAPR